MEATIDTTSVKSWKAHSEYQGLKNCWVSEIPATWNAKRLKFLAEASNARLKEKPIDLPYLGMEHVQSKTGQLLLDNEIETVDSNMGVFSEGDVLFGKLRPYLAKVAAPDFPGVCSTELIVYRPLAELQTDYLKYQLISREFINFVNANAYGTKMPRVSETIMGNLRLAVPPLEEQQAIAAFLDRETARIDALIGYKERLIALLEEKCQAVISQAVTRGLGPNAMMKETRHPTISAVPDHWDVLALKWRWDVTDCKHRTVKFLHEGYPVASIGEVHGIDVDLSNANYTSEEEYLDLIGGGRRPKHGDIIYSRNATVGEAAYVNTDEDFCLGQDVCLITSKTQNQRYLVHQLRSSVVMQQLEALMVGSTFKRINVGNIREFAVCCPPKDEQDAIAEHCDSASAEFANAIQRVRDGIVRLQEYRAALISAAVTGQIDVREEVQFND